MLNWHSCSHSDAAAATATHWGMAFGSRLAAGICNDFERKLRELNPQLRSITYDIGDLYSWIDNMPDLRCGVGCSVPRFGLVSNLPALDLSRLVTLDTTA